MNSTINFETSYSLLERARDKNDHTAWSELFERYENFVYYVLKTIGMKDSELDDIAQIIAIKLTEKLKLYDENKGKFRNWFFTFTKNTALLYARKQNIYDSYVEKYQSETIFDHPDSYIDDFIDQEWEAYIKNIVIERIQRSHQGKASEIFALTLDGLSTSEIAAKLNIKPDSVYTIRNRFRDTLREEYKAIKEGIELE